MYIHHHQKQSPHPPPCTAPALRTWPAPCRPCRACRAGAARTSCPQPRATPALVRGQQRWVSGFRFGVPGRPGHLIRHLSPILCVFGGSRDGRRVKGLQLPPPPPPPPRAPSPPHRAHTRPPPPQEFQGSGWRGAMPRARRRARRTRGAPLLRRRHASGRCAREPRPSLVVLARLQAGGDVARVAAAARAPDVPELVRPGRYHEPVGVVHRRAHLQRPAGVFAARGGVGCSARL
jgi:hypothetical protein